MPPKKRRLADNVEFYDFDDPQSQPSEVQEEYTSIDSTSHGYLASDSFLSVPPSPTKKPTQRAHAVSNAQDDTCRLRVDVEAMFAEHFAVDVGSLETREEDERAEEGAGGNKQPRAQVPSDLPTSGFVEKLDMFLDEILRLEAPDNQSLCGSCGCELSTGEGFRCKACFSNVLHCQGCMVREHSRLPFHSAERWNGKFFERVSLMALGLRIQLGHPDGQRCPVPKRPRDDSFVIVHADGISSVGLDFCGCSSGGSHWVQLLRHRLFPATTAEPQTAATFHVLETYQMLAFTSKTSAYEFVRALERRTDNTGTQTVPDRYPSFLRIAHLWQHIRMMKRAGRGHSLSGIEGTAPGECALLCPACPYPQINLPEGWDSVEDHKRFVYRLFLAMDANFRLKRKDVSSDERDPGLNKGYAYMVDDKSFRSHLAAFDTGEDEEKSTCNNHDAIKSASIRGGKGIATTGVGIAMCARHDMRRPESAGDLHKGERFVYMDYFALRTICHNTPDDVVWSYDIGCQWSQKLEMRTKKYPKALSTGFNRLRHMIFMVPKYHLAAHIAKCQAEYSFNFTKGVGRTEAESPERGWGGSNALAASTSQMGPGSRRDKIDSHWGDDNWLKIVAMAVYLVKRAEEAIQKRREQVEAFLEFSKALPKDSVAEWTEQVLDWEEDPACENPFLSKAEVLTADKVREALAAEDRAAVDAGEVVLVHKNVGPSVFIRMGLELESAQAKLAIDTKELGTHSTSRQRAMITERSTTVRRKVGAWRKLQAFFMPSVAAYQKEKEEEDSSGPDDTCTLPLYLPSAVPESVPYDKRLARYEHRYRVAQGETVLQQIRTLLILRSHMWQLKKKYTQGYRQTTRANALIGTIGTRIDNNITRYKLIRACLSNLTNITADSSWEATLRVLTESDVRGMTIDDDEGGEGSKQLSWIWRVGSVAGGGDQTGTSDLRLEWCKTRARAHRWQEECVLLAEEIRRVEVTFEWEAKRWRDRAAFQQSSESWVDPPVTEFNQHPSVYSLEVAGLERVRQGKVAYAHRQAAIRDAMILHAKKTFGSIRSQLMEMWDGKSPWIMVEAT
ncbi:hypothetical protein CC1G_02416 [Coprinopsis cinerea okayama7|uniref:CxC2-like cysteine cluster KDZ transposase-associated domain-containing protein n=1 Tax=Coprinopsis cinerea (strain Okayama-7 / 130 / ATCC MYA-4618 / FGSC 9003) TaxID=240176 RepID=A8NBF6_COPC7|nr:hypothetical protein CC1G_02416 [Coprinopsis cinerea okayama7\|eukprot:XP_001832154.1 hypothetical protein CC1G_02416 [Coprinopsis cinerea okayama7\